MRELKRYRKNKKELQMIDRQIESLEGRLEEVETVSGKVSKSDDDFPYILGHLTVKMPEPKLSSEIKDRIAEKERRRKELIEEIEKAEAYIHSLPDGDRKVIFELFYLDGEKQCDIADALGYSQGRVSQILNSGKD